METVLPEPCFLESMRHRIALGAGEQPDGTTAADRLPFFFSSSLSWFVTA